MDPSEDPRVVERVQADAHSTSAFRVLVVTALASFAAVLTKDGEWTASDVFRNGLLAAAAWWALLPGLRRGGPQFGRRYHWTSFLFLPAVVLTILMLLGAWDVLRS